MRGLHTPETSGSIFRFHLSGLCPFACFSYTLSVMNLLDRISVEPTIRFGKPCVRGTRITVGDILGYLAGGMSEDEIVSQFPQLEREDIKACLAYAAERERRTVGTSA
jgi:uncharacterized protein (DUF433 family)